MFTDKERTSSREASQWQLFRFVCVLVCRLRNRFLELELYDRCDVATRGQVSWEDQRYEPCCLEAGLFSAYLLPTALAGRALTGERWGEWTVY